MRRYAVSGNASAWVLGLVLALSLYGSSGNAAAQGAKPGAKQGPPPSPVAVAIATERELAPVTWYPGTVISRNRARLSAEVEGRLEHVAEVGTQVRQGEEVARIDQMILNRVLTENLAAIEREQARLDFLEAEVVRLAPLVKKRTTTRSRFEEAVSERGVTRGELAATEARAALTRERVNRAVLRAPFDGVVAERYLQAGEWADNGDAVLRLVDTRNVEIQVWVPVQSLDFVSPGGSIKVRGNPHDIPAEVRTIVPVGDSRSRLYELRLSPEKGQWTVGRSVRVAIPTARPRLVVAVPRDALVLRRTGAAVFRVTEDGKAERVPVKTGIGSGDVIEVSGISPGDRVVTRGGERLRPGQTVNATLAEDPKKP